MANKYKKIKLKDGSTRDEHRLIMEQYIRRKLRRNEIVHHKNDDRFDNRIENLEIMSRSEHTKMHLGRGDYTKSEEQLEKVRRVIYPGDKFKCPECRIIKIRSEFRKSINKPRGVSSSCKKCMTAYDKWYNANKRKKPA